MLTSANQVYDWVEENKRSALEVSPDVSLAEFYVVGYRQAAECLQHKLRINFNTTDKSFTS